MKNCIKFELPILSILSATVSPANLDWNWLIWLTVTTGCNQEFIKESISTHSVLEFCVSNGFVGALDKSFKIFFDVSLPFLIYYMINKLIF